ncbi:hypothetical protein [Nitrolancea hollandica]|uniref:Uncharacterized protein n=1 Tax=Nitrolancea hollandica Lb TaxID=1129897 RepID=I4EMY2_9BACT|nr:hypothetical protein [Nitrolancea hollandica]CCF86045.1 exported hypothetical protein [Nitrolancea hollandica Lb]
MNENANGTRRNLLIGLGLLLLVILVLGGAWMANARFQPSADIVLSPESSTPTATTPASPAAPSASAVAPLTSGMATPDPELERAVEQAYLRYWERYSAALETLDTSRVPEVATGEELARIKEEVDGIRQRGLEVHMDVSHKYLIFDVGPEEAKVYDEMLNRSYSIDPEASGPSQEADMEGHVKDTFFFQNVNGIWKVTNSVRHEG